MAHYNNNLNDTKVTKSGLESDNYEGNSETFTQIITVILQFKL